MTGSNNPIELLVGISADTAGSKAGIESQLRDLSKQLKGLDLAVSIDDAAFKQSDTAIKNTEKSMFSLQRATQSFQTSFSKGGSEVATVVKRYNEGLNKIEQKSLRTIEDVRKSFEGQDFTIKTDFDTTGASKVLKGLQVDVKTTEDVIERLTYKLEKVGDEGDFNIVVDSMKQIDSAAFNVGKKFQDATDKIALLRHEGKLSADAFDELNQKAGQISESSGFDGLNQDIKLAVSNQKQLTAEIKVQKSAEEQLQASRQRTLDQLERMSQAGKLDYSQAGSFADSAGSAKSIEDMERLRQSIALTAQEHGKLTKEAGNSSTAFTNLNNKIEDLTISTKLSSKEAEEWMNKYSSSTSAQGIKDVNRELTVHLNKQKQTNAELKEQEGNQKKINTLINQMVTAQNKNPKAFGENAEFDKMLDTVKQIDPASAGAKKSIDGVSEGFKTMKAEAQTAGRESMSVMDSFKVAMQKFPVWMAASTAFYGTVRSIKSAISQILEIDQQLTVMKRVAGGQTDVNDVLAESVRLAGELGNAITDVNEGFIAFARQGFRGEELSYMAEMATLLGNISDLSIEDSSSVLTAGIKGFNIEAEDSIRIVNAMNEVDNNYSITTKDLGTAMMRSAGAASTYGVSLEETIGYTTAIGQVTRESGSIIGNSLKSIYSRITSIQPAIDAMGEIGINIKDAGGEMRDVSSIIDDLGGKWSELSAEQQQNLGLQIAGRFQLSRFLILMNQYEEAQNATITATNSAGSAYRENQEYLKSYEAQINMVKNAWTETVIAMENTGLGDAMVVGLKAGLGFFKALTSIVDRFGILPTILGAAGIAFAIFSTSVKASTMSTGRFLISLLTMPPAFLRLNASMATSVVSTRIFSGAMALAGASLKALRTGLVFLTGVALPIAGFMALGAAITFVTSKVTEHKQAQKELRDEIEKTTQSDMEAITTNAEQVDTLIDSYKRLSDQKETGQWNTDNEKEYLAIQQELGELFPSLIDHIDAKGRSHLIEADSIAGVVGRTEELLEVERALQLLGAKEDYQQKINDINDQTKAIEKQKDTLETLAKWKAESDKGGVVSESDGFGSSKTVSAEEIERRIYEAEQAIIHGEIILSGAWASLNSSMEEIYVIGLVQSTDRIIPKVQESMQRIIAEFDLSKLTSELDPHEMGVIVDQITNYTKQLDEAFRTGESSDYNKIADSMQAYLMSKGLESDAIEKLIPLYSDMKSAVEADAEAKKIAGTIVDEFGESMDGAVDGVDGLGNSVDDASDKIHHFADVLETVSGVSKELMEGTDDLIYVYDELTQLAESLGGAQNMTAESAEALAYSQDTLLQLYPQLSSESLSLLDTYERLSDGTYNQAVESEELAYAEERLLELHPHLADAGISREGMINSIIDHIRAEVEANDVLIAANQASANGSLTAQEQTARGVLKSTNDRIKTINAEIAALQLLSEAHQAAFQTAKQSYEKAKAAGDSAGMDAAGKGMMRASQFAGSEASIWSKQAELAVAISERTAAVNILQKSEAVMNATTSRGNKARNEAAKSGGKAADAAKKGAGATDKAAKAAKEAAKEAELLEKAQEELNKEIERSIFITDLYKKALENLNVEMAKIGQEKSKYPAYSKGYQDALKKELAVMKQMQTLREKEGKHIAAQIKSGNVVKTGVVTSSSTSSGGSYTGKYATEINRAAQKHGVSPQLIAAVIQAESNFNPNARSGAGAQGLMQLMPATARGLGVKNSYNAAQNIDGGTKYLAQQLKAFGGDIKLALAAYNAGPGNVRKYGGIPPFKETQNYIKKITAALAKTSNTVSAASTGNGGFAGDYLNKFRITSGFGPRKKPSLHGSSNHQGTDFAAPAGTDIKSLRAGKVTEIIWNKYSGNAISIRQDDGTIARYQHMQSKSPLKKGQSVAAGQNIGKVGATGIGVTGPHLHLEIMQNGKKVDPLKYINEQKKAVASSTKVTAEAARDIDGLTSDLNTNAIDTYQAMIEIAAKEREIIESERDKFRQRNESYNRVLSYEAEKLKTLDINSQRYSATIERQGKFLEYKQQANQQELYYVERMIRSGTLSAIVYDEMKISAELLRIEMLGIADAISKNNFQLITASLLVFDEAVGDLNYSLERSRLVMALLDEGSYEYGKELAYQLDILKELAKKNKLQREELQKSILTVKLGSEEYEAMAKKIQELSLAYWGLEGQIKDTDKTLKESGTKMAEDAAEKLVEVYKKYLEEKRDMHIKSLEEESTAEDDRHKKVMENYSKELDQFRKIVQERINSIDKEESERDYGKEMQKLEEERLKILNKINILSLDDSLDAKAERKRLQEDLDNIDEEIGEKRHRREVDLRKENLNDILTDKEEEMAEKEKIENEYHDSEKDRIDKLQKYWNQFYVDQLNDEREFARIKKEIVAGNFEAISKEFTDYLNTLEETMPSLENTLDGTMKAVGTSIRQNIIEELERALELLGKVKEDKESSNAESGGGGSGTDAGKKGVSGGDLKVLTAKFLAEKVNREVSNPVRQGYIRDRASAMAKQGRDEGSEMRADQGYEDLLAGMSQEDLNTFANHLRAQGVGTVSTPELQDFILEYAKKLQSGTAALATGGQTPAWGSGGKTAILHEKELILSKSETGKFFDSIPVLERLNSLLRLSIPTVSAPDNAVSSGDTYEFNFEVENMHGSKQEATSFMSDAMRQLKRKRGGH